ncbi:MAG: YybH family protein [Syntrophothermus sp.]
MRTKLSMVVIFVYSLLSFSCLLIAQGRNNNITTEQAKEKIQQINEKWAGYLKNGNYQGVADFYANDAVVLPNNSKLIRGKDAIKKHLEDENKDTQKFTTVDFKTVNVIGSNDLFVEIGQYKIALQKRNMNKPVLDEGKYVTVYKLMPDGTLKVIVDTDNTDMSMKDMQNAAMQNIKTDNDMTGGKKNK